MERCSSPSVLSKKPSTTTRNDSLLGCRKRSAPGKGGETKLAPVCPCVRFWGPGRGKRHQHGTRQALLKLCEQQLPRQLPREALGYEVSVFSCGKAPGFSLVKIQTKGAESRQKKKSRPSKARKGGALEHGTSSIEKRFFLHSEG